MSIPNEPTEPNAGSVPDGLVSAAIRAAERHGLDVADVPLVAIAREAGVSRSTLLRRVGGSRRVLDRAVHAAGVDPGGREPVRERAIRAAAHIISEHGLRAATMEAVAAGAECSVHSVYAAFGGRDGLLLAVFEQHSPLLALEEVLALPDEDLTGTVRRVHRLLAAEFSREPRVLPAMLAEVLSRPEAATADIFQQVFFPRMLAGLGGWLSGEVRAGRIRDLPLPLLMQQLIGPVAVHFMLRPVLGEVPGVDLPDPEPVCAVFTEAFVRAVALPPPAHTRQPGQPRQPESTQSEGEEPPSCASPEPP